MATRTETYPFFSVALQEVVEVLAQQPPSLRHGSSAETTGNSVTCLLDMCPTLEGTVDAEEAEVLVALGHLIECSDTSCASEVLARLLHAVQVLLRLEWSHPPTSESFARRLVAVLGRVVAVHPTYRPTITTAILDSLVQLEENVLSDSPRPNAFPLLVGVLQGLAQVPLPLSADQYTVFHRSIQALWHAKEDVSFKVLLFRAIVGHSENDKEPPFDTLMTAAARYLAEIGILQHAQGERGQRVPVDYVVPALAVAVRCGIRDPSAGAATLKLLLEVMRIVVQCDGENGEDESETSFLYDVDTDNVKLLTEVVRGMAEMGATHEMLAEEVAKRLRVLLLSPSSFVYRVKGNSLRDEIIAALTKILKVDATLGRMQRTNNVVYELSQALDTCVDSTVQNNAVLLLGQIACTLNLPKVTMQFVFPILMNNINKPPSPLHVLLVEQLTEVAMLGNQTAFREVVELLCNAYRRPFDTQNKYISNAVPNAFLRLALGLGTSPQRSELVRRFIKLFSELGLEIQRKVASNPNIKASALAGHMGVLLPALAELTSGVPHCDIMNPSRKIVRAFRNIWYGEVSRRRTPGKWLPEWFDAVKRIAANTPVLVMKKFYLETELELNRAWKLGTNERDLQELRGALVGFLPEQSASIWRFSFGQCTYLLSLCHVETLRVHSGHFRTIFAYETDSEADAARGVITECLIGIAETAFRTYAYLVAAHAGDLEWENRLEESVEFILINCCNRKAIIRAMADRFVAQLLQRFPRLLWSKRCLSTLFDLLDAVGTSLYDRSPQTEVTLPSSRAPLDLTESRKERQDMASLLVRRCSEWLSQANALAPRQTQALLHEYLIKFHQTGVGLLHHAGFSLAIDLGSHSTSPGVAPSLPRVSKTPYVGPMAQGFSLKQATSSAFVTSLQLKSHYLGEIAGLKLLQDVCEDSPSVDIQTILPMHLLKQFESCVRTWEHDPDEREYSAVMYRATAFMVSEQVIQHDLLRMLCWLPAFIFTKTSMEVGILLWAWLLSALPGYAVEIMLEIRSAWTWTAEKRWGLFSGPGRPGFMTTGTEVVDKDSAQEANMYPHRLWLDFLLNRFEVVKANSLEQVDILKDMVLAALHTPENLSTAPASIGVRFSLLLLALRIYNEWHTKQNLEILRFRVYTTAFNWFTVHPTWYNRSDTHTYEEDVLVLIELCKLVQRDEHYIPTSVSAPSTPEPRDRVVSSRSSAFSFSYHRPLNLGAESVESASEAGVTTERQAPARDGFSSIRKILILLVGHEIDRLCAWSNPQNEASSQLREEKLFTAEKQPSSEFVQTAWNISPKLAIQLAVRFPAARAELEKLELVRADPLAVIDVPDAVLLLATESNVVNDIPELKHLLYWAPVPLSVAVSMLSRTYHSHPLVTQYAIRVIDSYTPSETMFYLTQFVQALRYDEEDIVEDFLLRTCRKSTLFSHQLLWILKTEDEPEREGVLVERARRLFRMILASLTEAQMKCYEQESSFFDKFTDISGMLPPKDERNKARIAEELPKIRLEGDLYLPTNPDLRVVGIKADSGRAMKSAAKVPIMVTFCVAPRPLDANSNPVGEEGSASIHRPTTTTEKGKRPSLASNMLRRKSIAVEYMPDPGTSTGSIFSSSTRSLGGRELGHSDTCLNSSYTGTRFQSLIFKWGDDSRQDQLVLQIIAFIRNVFESVGLELYLFPYRVVTTGPKLGVIECVPNTKSRHQLGTTMEGNLYNHFKKKYGCVGSPEFQKAQKNFIMSMAAYSVVSFVLQIKDRHNGNILVDDQGHIVHIDFGFIFDISPGGNIKWERSPFKLNQELISIMGNSMDAEPFRYYMDLCCRGYLALRPHMQSIVGMVELMQDSGLKCFTPQSINNLRRRFTVTKSERGAAHYLTEKIRRSYLHIMTVVYDGVQLLREGIEC